MLSVGVDQVRRFRLRAHHLDRSYDVRDALALAGACGMQNTPPGAWEAALFNRAPTFRGKDAERLLYGEKSLVQAWSLRGAPVVFPAAESDAFLSALVPRDGEPWIYTNGIRLALDALGIGFAEALDLVRRATALLDERSVASKAALDQVLADAVEPLLPEGKRAAWREPSMYGSPDRQTVGGAAVSFLLRPCSFLGLVVFGERDGVAPTFTSYRRWLGHALEPADDAAERLVRKFVHCYGPTRPDALAKQLGCSGAQARRLWKLVADELEPVGFGDGRAWALAADRDALASSGWPERRLLLLAAHDPYLDQRDRATLQADRALQRRIWRTVANPGVVVRDGEAVGVWTSKKQARGLTISCEVWSPCDEARLRALAEEYAAFRGQPLLSVSFG
ncbi:winged helix DNA-binding domain-containing protein [Eggerthella timonensis]|uniref:winged helix DNA-binding domain-containing protein n=1 Tax=Eggerthella timonensis TaxID=1871008 RepID=UPI000C7752E5|nr:winged helix DNA-binding domain-containing protein [Eggerthella timonensis]